MYTYSHSVPLELVNVIGWYLERGSDIFFAQFLASATSARATLVLTRSCTSMDMWGSSGDSREVDNQKLDKRTAQLRSSFIFDHWNLKCECESEKIATEERRRYIRFKEKRYIYAWNKYLRRRSDGEHWIKLTLSLRRKYTSTESFIFFRVKASHVWIKKEEKYIHI